MRPLSQILPKHLVRIEHTGPLRVFALSDYGVHDVKLLLDLVRGLVAKPDLILYAGDEIDMFVGAPGGSLERLYTYGHQEATGEHNYFEELAREARYGLGAVRGNDDRMLAPEYIKGEKVYDLHYTWLKVGSYLIIGLEDAPAKHDILGYAEADYRLRLELAKSLLGRRDKLIVVSHAPPRGVLDRAGRYGEKSIGSLALREFIEEFDKLVLVVCGHVHRYGGMYERLGNAIVVNVSSHDDEYSRANVAWITAEGGTVNVELKKLPSPVERVFKGEDRSFWNKMLQERLSLSEDEAELFVTIYERFGERLFEDLERLASLKLRYSFTWDNVFRFYAYGVMNPEQITKEVYLKVLRESKFPHNINLRRAFARLLRELKSGLYLIDPLPFSSEDKLVVFDIEYVPGRSSVLFGFLDLATGEIRQFLYNEQDKLKEFLAYRRNHVFIHWGGEDKERFRRIEKGFKIVDLLSFAQASLIAPITSHAMKDVHDALCGRRDEKWWREMFYNMDGLYKRDVCLRVLESGDPKDIGLLGDINKADLIALACIVKKMLELPVKTDID